MADIADSITTVSQLLLHGYGAFGDRTAAVDARGSLTFAELGKRAARIAGELTRRGVRCGDRVAMVMSNRNEFPQVEQALALGGFVRVGAITRLHASEVAHIIGDAQPAYAFIENGWLAGAGAGFLSGVRCPIVVIGAGGEAHAPHEAGTERFETFLGAARHDPELPATLPEDLAWFMYTSGSTGKPKGVMHTHRTIVAMIRNTLRVMRAVRADDVAIHTAPLSHFSGAIAHAVQACGGTNVLLERFQPGELFDAVDEHHATVLPVVPTQLNMLTEHLHRLPRDLSRIRIVPYAGSAIAPDRLAAAKRFFGDALVQYYGSSEVPMPITALQPEDHVDTVNELGLPRFAAAGRAVAGVEVSIRDQENRALPAGEPGEIVVRSPAGTPGYWRNPDASAEILEADGFVHTGDIGIIDDGGFLFVVDRKKDMIVTGGFNVFPREVENAIASMPTVLEVAVVSAPDDRWGESIVAVIAPRGGSEITLEQVQAHCRERLAGYKVPRRLLLMDELPKGSTGKLQKLALKERFWEGRDRKVGG